MNPLDSVPATIVAGFILTGILFILVRIIV